MTKKEFLRQLTLSMAAMDPLAWRYYMSARLEERERQEEQGHLEEQIVAVVRNCDPRIVAAATNRGLKGLLRAPIR
jgi:uncharacterized membrane protein